jgi:hypothetical protein
MVFLTIGFTRSEKESDEQQHDVIIVGLDTCEMNILSSGVVNGNEYRYADAAIEYPEGEKIDEVETYAVYELSQAHIKMCSFYGLLLMRLLLCSASCIFPSTLPIHPEAPYTPHGRLFYSFCSITKHHKTQP